MTIESAFDELRFGRERTLNLRASLPTGAEATRRAEAWLRERQIARVGEVLVVTGRGNSSAAGVAVVREAIARLLAGLARRGVVAEWREHNAGSFVIRLASVRALYEAPKSRTDRPSAVTDPKALAGLDPHTRGRLRLLALRRLDALGVNAPGETLVHDEMVTQFAALAAAVPQGLEREAALRASVERALLAHEDDDA